MRLLRFFYLFVLLLATGCSTLPDAPIEQSNVNQETRIQQLLQKEQWQVKGKIAFIQPDKRQSANLIWQYNNVSSINEIDLTTFLGINILKVSHDNGVYHIEFDDKSYYSDALDSLIYDLTGLLIPTDALPFWMQAIPFNSDDQVEIGKNNLPSMMTSQYKQENWNITYKTYKMVNNVPMPHSITIKKNGFTLKLAIKQWTMN